LNVSIRNVIFLIGFFIDFFTLLGCHLVPTKLFSVIAVASGVLVEVHLMIKVGWVEDSGW
jgi:hypothetical protein